jgi:hypothetical protein
MSNISCHGVTIAYVFQTSNVHWSAISLFSMQKMVEVEDREMYGLREQHLTPSRDMLQMCGPFCILSLILTLLLDLSQVLTIMAAMSPGPHSAVRSRNAHLVLVHEYN